MEGLDLQDPRVQYLIRAELEDLKLRDNLLVRRDRLEHAACLAHRDGDIVREKRYFWAADIITHYLRDEGLEEW